MKRFSLVCAGLVALAVGALLFGGSPRLSAEIATNHYKTPAPAIDNDLLVSHETVLLRPEPTAPPADPTPPEPIVIPEPTATAPEVPVVSPEKSTAEELTEADHLPYPHFFPRLRDGHGACGVLNGNGPIRRLFQRIRDRRGC